MTGDWRLSSRDSQWKTAAEDSTSRRQQQQKAAVAAAAAEASKAKAGAKRGRLRETKRSTRDSEFKVRNCSGSEGGTHFALAPRCSAPRGHLRKHRKLKVAVDARPIRLKLGTGGPKGEIRCRRSDALAFKHQSNDQ